MWAKQKGFTIVELLIVIVVIGILAAISLVAYSNVQASARDSSRASSVASIKKGIELYKADNGFYPAVCAGGDNAGCSVNSLVTALVPTYVSAVPQDPQYSSKSFAYVRGSDVSYSYAIYISGYETKSACKTGNNVSAGWWGSAVPTC